MKFYNKAQTRIHNLEEAIFWVTRIFIKNLHEFINQKDNSVKKIFNHKALKTCVKFLDQLIQFCENDAYLDIKNSSIYILVDHLNDHCIIKLIDLSYVENYVDTNRRDLSFIYGLKSLRTTLDNIDNSIIF